MTGTKKGPLLKNVLILSGLFFILISLFMITYRIFLNPDISKSGSSILEPSSPDFKILFLDSYSPTHSSYASQEAGLKEGLYPNNISYDVIYMDTKNYGSQDQVEDFYEFFKKRMENRAKKYDGIVTGDDAALAFVLKYQEEFFKDIPVVFYGVNNLDLAKVGAENPLITGFSEETYLDTTIDLAIQLMPYAKKITAIYDDTPTGKGDGDTFNSYASRYPSFKFSGINTSQYTRKELENILEKISNDTILIYLTAFNDVDGNNYTIPQSIQLIVDHTHIPVFRNYSEGQGQGILGGIMMNFPEQCRMVGQTMNDILRGNRNVSEIPLNTQTSGIVSYDYALMKKFNLDMSKLPPETVFNNKPVNYFKKSSPFIVPIFLIVGGLLLVVAGLIVNTSILKAAESILKYDSEHDLLTGLYNHHAAECHLEKILVSGRLASMIRFDIDNFKSMNETYGHVVGDDYLRFVSTLMKKYAESNNYFVARFSGDEFLIIIPGQVIDRNSPVVKDLHDLFKKSMTVGMEHVSSTISIGIANSEPGITVGNMFLHSDIAMESAKSHGKNTALLFSPDFEEKAKKFNRVRQKIVDAIENDGFYMVYQPKVDTKTKKLVGYEALVRMKDSTVGPAEFIPIAEQSGLISRIGRLTTEFTVKQLSQWKKEGVELKNVSINYSCNQISDIGYVSFLKDLLKEYDIDPKYIGLEITEGLFMENSWQAGNLFRQLQAMGVQILMDDFGTGYSSLSYLTYIPVDVLKLDKSLVNVYLIEGKDLFIKDIISLAHDLGKQMVIEGVEEKWQYQRLKEFGADVIQGYYFSRPLKADEAARFKVEDGK